MEENLHNNFDDFLRDKLGGEPPPNSAFSANRRETDSEWTKVTQRLENIKPVTPPASAPHILRFLYPAAAIVVLAFSGLAYLYHENNLKIEALRNEVVAVKIQNDVARLTTAKKIEKNIIYKNAGSDSVVKEAPKNLNLPDLRSTNGQAQKTIYRNNATSTPVLSIKNLPNEASSTGDRPLGAGSKKETPINGPLSQNRLFHIARSEKTAPSPVPPAETVLKTASVESNSNQISNGGAVVNKSDVANRPDNHKTDPVKRKDQPGLSKEEKEAGNPSVIANDAILSPQSMEMEANKVVQPGRNIALTAIALRTPSELKVKKITFEEDLTIPVVRRKRQNPFSIAGVRLGLGGDLNIWNNFIYKRQSATGAGASAEVLIGKRLSAIGALGYAQTDFTRDEMDLDHFRPDDHPMDMKPGRLAGTWKYMNYDAGMRYYPFAAGKWTPFIGAGFNWQKDVPSLGRLNFFDVHDHDHHLGPAMDKPVNNDDLKSYVHFNAGLLYPLSARFALQAEGVYGKRTDSGSPELSNYYGMNLKVTINF